MKRINKIIDQVLFVLIFVLLLASFVFPKYRDVMVFGNVVSSGDVRNFFNILYIIFGFIGVIYIIFAVIRLFFSRIKFDLILVKGNFLLKVINIVLFVPITFTSLFIVINIDKDTEDVYRQLAKNLLFSDHLYFKEASMIPIGDTVDIDKAKVFAKLLDWDMMYDTIDDRYYFVREQDVSPEDIVAGKNEEPSVFWTVFYHYIDPGNQHIATTKTGRKWATIIAISGYFLLNGLLIAVIVGWFDRRRHEWIKGEVRYRRFLRRKKHYIIIGGNDMVPGIVKLLKEKKEYILIQTSRDVESFRRELYSDLTEEEQRHIVIYYGNRSSKSDIEDLGLAAAIDIYVVGEPLASDGQNHDAYNMDCLRLLTDVLPDGCERKDVHVIFENQITFSSFQFSDISLNDKKKINYKPYNYYEMWAQKVLAHSDPTDIIKQKNKMEYCPLDMIDKDRFISRDDEHYVHLVIVGMSRMGIAMGLEAAHIAHYPNALTSKGPRTRITFIDENADRESGYMMNRYCDMFALARWRYADASAFDSRKGDSESLYADFSNEDDTWHDPLYDKDSISPYKDLQLGVDGDKPGDEFFVDIEWEFIKGGLSDFSVQQYLRECANKECHPDKILTVAICLEEPHQAIAGGLYLPDVVYDNALQILVYQRFSDSILQYLAESATSEDIGKNERYKNVKPFGMLSETFSLMLTDDYLAKLINYVYTYTAYKDDDNEQIYDFESDTYRWEILDDVKDAQIYSTWNNAILKFDKGKSGCACRWSNIYHANTLRTKLRGVGWKEGEQMDMEKIMTMAMTEHNRWTVEQLLMHYSPVSKKEQEELQRLNASDKDEHRKRKNALKKKMRHVDICSYNRLEDVDAGVEIYDISISGALPYFVKRYNEKIQGHDKYDRY